MENIKAYFDKFDIMKRYNIGVGTALGIIRTIRFFNGGGSLPPGKILPRELENWESREEFNRRVFIPYKERVSSEELVSYAEASRVKVIPIQKKGEGE